MTNILFFAVVAVVLLAALWWLARHARKDHGGADLLQTLPAEKILPQHYKYFPQVRQALSNEDAQYLARRANPAVARLARHARRGVALGFLTGLREDYTRLDRLARVLAALAPNADSSREADRFRLSIQFNFLWGLVWFRVWTGAAPVTQILQLSELIGSVAARLEVSMKALQELPAVPQSQSLSA